MPKKPKAKAEKTIFKKIIDGDLPAYKVYEDDFVLAFLDISPLSFGHLLLIPKEEKAKLHELSDESARALGQVLPRLCRALVRVSACEDYNLLQNNGRLAHQEVPHVHFHLIPKKGSGSGLQMTWEAGLLKKEEALLLVKKLTQELNANV